MAELEYEPNGPPTVRSFTLTEKREPEREGSGGGRTEKERELGEDAEGSGR